MSGQENDLALLWQVRAVTGSGIPLKRDASPDANVRSGQTDLVSAQQIFVMRAYEPICCNFKKSNQINIRVCPTYETGKSKREAANGCRSRAKLTDRNTRSRQNAEKTTEIAV